MALNVPPLSDVVAKWASRSAGAAQAYRAGIQRVNDWDTRTADANDTYVAAVVEAANAGRFASGVRRAGNSRWQRKSLDLGAQRFGPGVAAAQADYSTGFAPYLTELSSLTLSPRGPRGAPQNFVRAQEVATAMRNLFLQQSGQ